ncbi:hypothetical protein FB451DRAFT_1551334 [Mycena latifolia]|nr:hypothetical protein FB451DRAFT_1551334 [Mycena latifolia]
MPPLTRQQTFQSILSWWSDSNAPGATINLHAAAKPLMKLMYHRQALGFVKRNNAIPLSPETVEIYSSYLLYAGHRGGKRATLSLGMAWITELIPRYQSTAATVIDLNPCQHLVAISRQVDSAADYDARCASDVLVAISNWEDGAEAAVAAQILEHIPKRFASPYIWMRESACRLLANLARHKSTAGAVMDPKLCAQLVTILEISDPDDYLAFYTLEALVKIANWPTGAEAVVAAKVLDHTATGLESRYEPVRRSTCDLLAALARHESTAQAVARAVPRERLIALLRDEDYFVRECADKALQVINDYLARTQVPMDEPGEPNVLYILG